MADDRYIQRHGAETLRVHIMQDYRSGNLDSEVPSIAITAGAFMPQLFLTWREARDLAAALLHVEGIANHG